MPIVKKKRGTGITEHELTVIRGPYGQKERAAFARIFQNEPFDRVIDEWARAILTKAGVPGTKEAKLNADGTITGDLPDGWEKDPRHKLGPKFVKAGDTLGLVTDKFGWDSLEGYAARALGKIGLYRATLDRAPREAAYFSFELGLIMQECFMKFRFEADAITGKKVRDGGARGGPPPGQKAERDRDLAREYLRRQKESGLSATALKEKIGRGRGLGRSASIEAINRGVKILSG